MGKGEWKGKGREMMKQEMLGEILRQGSSVTFPWWTTLGKGFWEAL